MEWWAFRACRSADGLYRFKADGHVPGSALDTTGTSVDYGSVLSYLIGRSQHGNITAAAVTNDKYFR